MGQNQMSAGMLDMFCFVLLKVVTDRSGVALPQLLLTKVESEMESGWKGKSRAALWQVGRVLGGVPPAGELLQRPYCGGVRQRGWESEMCLRTTDCKTFLPNSSDPVNKGFNRNRTPHLLLVWQVLL